MYKTSDCMLISVHLLKSSTFKAETEEYKIPESSTSSCRTPIILHYIFLLLSF